MKNQFHFNFMARALTALPVILALVPAYAWAQLFTQDSPFANPFEPVPGQKLKVGEIVHIQIKESNSAGEKTESKNEVKSSLTWTLTNLFGGKVSQALFGGQPGGTTGAQGTAVDFPNVGFNGTDNYDGKGESKLTGKVTARISAIVKRVLPSGNALIEARRTIVVGNDRKNILLTGIIRPDDIGDDHVISSDKVAEAQITYHGEGPIQDQGNPGLMNRILDYIPLF